MSVQIFVLYYKSEQLKSIPKKNCIKAIDLNEKDQRNHLAEHRFFLNMPQTNAKWIGCLTHRYSQYWPNSISLKELGDFPYQEGKVYSPHTMPLDQIWKGNLECCPTTVKYLDEFLNYTNLKINNRLSFLANQFICEAKEMFKFTSFFYDCFEKFKHHKYDDVVLKDQYKGREAACVMEYWSSIWFANKEDLEVVNI